MNKLNIEELKFLLLRVSEFQQSEIRGILSEQISLMESMSGLHTFLRLHLSDGEKVLLLPDGALGPRILVTDAGADTFTGELLLWVTNGLISHLEYAWYGDSPPACLPNPSQLMVAPR